jgi:alkylation response protein AidB-like acyl-CoA dehydrogenase
MSFAMNEDQALLADAATGFFGDKAPVSAFRALRDAGKTFDPALWDDMGAMGFAGALIGEDHGGTAMGYRALALVLEAQATGLAATPLLQTAWIASQALYMLGSPADQTEYLGQIASGQTTFALAWDEGPHHRTGSHATVFEAGQVTGTKRFVPDGGLADVLLVGVSLGNGSTGDGSRGDGSMGLALVQANAEGVRRAPLASVDARDLADITFEAAPARLLGGGGHPGAHFDGLLDVARMGVVAEMMGLTKAAYEMTLDYLKTRTQFGQLIGSFQALQHRASAMLVEMELTRSCVVAAYNALGAAATGTLDGQKLAQAVSLAKARAGDTMHLVTNEMIQMHGGIGMTDAHDSGFYLKRARVLEALYGSSAFHRDRWASLNGY